MNGTTNTSKPTGDAIMSAAKAAIRDEFPDAPPTATAHANKLANRLCELLAATEDGAVTAPVQAPSLLADEDTVALLRDLSDHARHINARHDRDAFVGLTGRPYCGWEHTWTADHLRVSYDDGLLRFLSHGAPLLKVRVVSVRQAAQVLAAIGVLPPRFAGGAR